MSRGYSVVDGSNDDCCKGQNLNDKVISKPDCFVEFYNAYNERYENPFDWVLE
jgi:hypothetical protein